jgi:hypothetical protein
MTKKTIDFNSLPKQEYMKPEIEVMEADVEQILAESRNEYNMNTSLQEEEVDEAYSRSYGNLWDDED